MSVDKNKAVTWGAVVLGTTIFCSFAGLTLAALSGFEEKYVTQQVFREVTAAQGNLIGEKLDGVRQAIEFTRLQVSQDGTRSKAIEDNVRDILDRVTRSETRSQSLEERLQRLETRVDRLDAK